MPVKLIRLKKSLLAIVVIAIFNQLSYAENMIPQDYLAFLQNVFAEVIPAPKTLWISSDLRERIKGIVDREYNWLRIRYWIHEGKTIWILNDLVKSRPITVGLVVNKHAVEKIEIITVSDRHSNRIKHRNFTDQFSGLTLNPGNKKLDRNIDGISGATLSVSAVHRLAKLALYLDSIITDRADLDFD